MYSYCLTLWISIALAISSSQIVQTKQESQTSPRNYIVDKNSTDHDASIFKLYDVDDYDEYVSNIEEANKTSNDKPQHIDNNVVIFKVLMGNLNKGKNTSGYDKVGKKRIVTVVVYNETRYKEANNETLRNRNKREVENINIDETTSQQSTTPEHPKDVKEVIINPEIAGLFNNLSELTCPCNPVLAQYEDHQYRTLDGSHNNLVHPEWGIAMSFYKRMLHPVYGDGISSPRRSNNKNELPSARLVVSNLCHVGQKSDHMRNVLSMQWGQIVAHDMSKFMSLDMGMDCCSPKNKNKSKLLCYPIKYPSNDKLARLTGITCQDYSRTVTDKMYGCNSDSNPARQINTVTPFLDLSNIYGSDDKTSKSLRSMEGGQLLVDQTDYTILPPREENYLDSCFCNKPGESVCFKTGDSRCNENPQLVIIYTVLIREHNRIAKELQYTNPSWSDEKLFQEARKINIAQYQHIVYYEWLPDLLGWKNLAHVDIIFPNAREHVNDYNPDVHPAIINEFATAAFKYYHSQIPGKMHLMDENNKVKSVELISEWFHRPQILEDINKLEQLTYGLLAQKCESCDNVFSKQITNSVYRCGDRRFVKDFKSMEVQRDRDHGLAYYNNYREICGLGAANSFDDFLDFIPQESVEILKKLYYSHEDVDLSIGGALETHWNGAQVGPTFLCIMIQQFKHSRITDRFFFESQSSGFTLEQLHEIRKSSISRILCDSADAIEHIHLNGFLNSPEDSPCYNEVITLSSV